MVKLQSAGMITFSDSKKNVMSGQDHIFINYDHILVIAT